MVYIWKMGSFLVYFHESGSFSNFCLRDQFLWNPNDGLVSGI